MVEPTPLPNKCSVKTDVVDAEWLAELELRTSRCSSISISNLIPRDLISDNYDWEWFVQSIVYRKSEWQNLNSIGGQRYWGVPRTKTSKVPGRGNAEDPEALADCQRSLQSQQSLS